MSDLPVELRDQLSIDTPELVSLEYPVAGIGSRAIACLLDYTLQGIAGGLIVMVLAFIAMLVPASTAPSAGSVAKSSPSDAWATAIAFLILFLFQWGYFTLFETFWNGRTPGKRLLRLRVMQANGRSIGFLDALTRNLLRVADGIPGFYLVGLIAVFATRQSQRLGDLVAGTIVVHEQKIETPLWDGNGARHLTAGLTRVFPTQMARSSGIPADKVGRLTEADLELIESFSARKLDLPLETSAALAARLAERMAAKMQTSVPSDVSADTFLDSLASDMRSLGRLAKS
jgi:uncharacterized RDD family membrane protein YckC